MVLGKIGENAGGKRQAMNAMLVESVRTDFHGTGAAAVIHHLGEQALDLQ